MKSKLKMSNKTLFSLLLMTISLMVYAQPKPQSDIKLDGVAAVVGNEIILDSDVQRDFISAKAQGLQIENHCEFLENILMEKLLVSRAKEDTLIKVTDDHVSRQVEGTIQRFLTQGSEEEILSVFGYNTMAEFKQDLRGIMKDQAYAQEKRRMIVSGTDATPEEVREFYEKYKNELPDVPDEVELSHIVIYPEITPENEQKVVDQLIQIKKEVSEGASFSTKAILYSQDPGSASNGGLIMRVSRGMMVPEFDAVVFNLEEGEVSDPFKTDYGYHIAMLEKRRGQELDVRHILIQLKPTREEIAASKAKFDSIRLQIINGEVTFKEVAFKYSQDKYTKFNGGRLTDAQTGEDRLERSKLPVNVLATIVSVGEGGVSNIIEDEFNKRPVLRMFQVNREIPTHKVNLETDYARIKNMTINMKTQDMLQQWVEEQINDTFIKVDSDFDDCQFRMNWRKEEK